MTTSEPSLAEEIFRGGARARRRAASTRRSQEAMSAPATRPSRSWSAASPRRSRRCVRCFEIIGKTIIHQGPAGAGQHTKMVNQTLIATGMIGVCEALLYAYRAGLDLETVLEAVSGGAAGSWSLSNYAPRMLKGDFAPGFMVEHFIKDMEITLNEARRMNLALPGVGARARALPRVACAGRWSRRHAVADPSARADVRGRLEPTAMRPLRARASARSSRRSRPG